VAKVASDADKPDGFLAIDCEQARQRFAASPPGLVPGIGPKTAAKLEARGITRLDQLGATPDETLSEWFGTRLGPHLAALARFEGNEALNTDRVRKSESKETTFDTDLRSLDEMEPVLADLARGLCEDLERNGRSGRTVGIKVRTDDFQIHTRARTLPAPVSSLDAVWPVALDLLRALDPARPVRLLGVRVAGMEDAQPARAAPWPGQLELELSV
jgi:DNA polymerase-4